MWLSMGLRTTSSWVLMRPASEMGMALPLSNKFRADVMYCLTSGSVRPVTGARGWGGRETTGLGQGFWMRSKPTESLRLVKSAVVNLERSRGGCLRSPVAVEVAVLMSAGASSGTGIGAAKDVKVNASKRTTVLKAVWNCRSVRRDAEHSDRVGRAPPTGVICMQVFSLKAN